MISFFSRTVLEVMCMYPNNKRPNMQTTANRLIDLQYLIIHEWLQFSRAIYTNLNVSSKLFIKACFLSSLGHYIGVWLVGWFRLFAILRTLSPSFTLIYTYSGSKKEVENGEILQMIFPNLPKFA